MSQPIKHGSSSVLLRVKLRRADNGQGITGLSHNSAGLIISTIADNEATAVAYAQGSSNIEDISTLGTYAEPTSGKCRFKEVDATNHKGLYEIQLANARFSVANAKKLVLSFSGASNLQEGDYEIELTQVDLQNATSGGITRLDDAITSRATAAQAAAADHQTILSGTLAGGSTTSATLPGSASGETDAYKDCALVITHSSGLKEARLITGYNGTTKQAALESDRPLKTTAANGEAFSVIAGAPASLSGVPDINLARIAGSATRATRFGEGNDLTPTVVVSTLTTTPTASLMRVTGMPSLGHATNLNGRPIYGLTGINNLVRRYIKSLTVIGGGEVEIEVYPPFPNAPAGDDQLQVR